MSIHDAMWISADERISSPWLKTLFNTKKEVTGATLQCCGLGYFEAYINNNKVSDDVLVPAQTDYENRELTNMLYPMNYKSTMHRVFYMQYDVTQMIAAGDNIFGLWLGNGFYRQEMRAVEGNVSYDMPKTIACLTIEYKDGTSKNIMTNDKDWYYHSSPIVFNNIFFGEKYDATLEIDDWCGTEGDFVGWEKAREASPVGGKLVKQGCPTDKVQETYEAKLIYQDTNKYIYDIGQNIAGWINIEVSGEKGERVTAKFAGNINDDYSLNFESCGGEKQIQQLEYRLNDKKIQSYSPRFSWAGFRYFEIVTDARILDVKAEFVGTKINKTGDFKCSNDMLNKLYDLYIITQRANMHGCITSDCPHRERLSYTGDGTLVTEPLMLSFDGYKFIRKWIDDLRDGQNIDTGHVPHTVPFMGGGGGPAWGSAIVIVPWRYYLQTGDVSVLHDMYESMQKWMRYLSTRTDGDYIIAREEPKGWCLGDWCAPGVTEIPEKYVNTCVYAHLALLMIKISDKLGIDLQEYKTLHKNIKNAIIQEWFDSDMNSFSMGRQGANALALWSESVPDGREKLIAETMANHIQNDCKGHLDTGIIATPILLDMLTKYGYIDTAYNIMSKTTYPSFGYMLENGATTIWERFEKKESDNHPMFGTYTAWFIKALAGINVDEARPGYKNILVNPQIPKELFYAQAKILTQDAETVGVKWEKVNDVVIVNLSIPERSTHAFSLPRGYELIDSCLSKKDDNDTTYIIKKLNDTER
jgi:alpha-L-rhamnosidase